MLPRSLKASDSSPTLSAYPQHREKGGLMVKLTDTHGTSADHFDYLEYLDIDEDTDEDEGDSE